MIPRVAILGACACTEARLSLRAVDLFAGDYAAKQLEIKRAERAQRRRDSERQSGARSVMFGDVSRSASRRIRHLRRIVETQIRPALHLDAHLRQHQNPLAGRSQLPTQLE